MTIYKKMGGTGGVWIKGKDVVSGTHCKLVSEVSPQLSTFMNKDGSPKTQMLQRFVSLKMRMCSISV